MLRRMLMPALLSGRGAAAPAFSPTDIPGLQLWLDFSDISTLFQDAAMTVPVTADGDVIGGVTDKSGNGKNAYVVTTGLKPTYKTAIQNGLSVCRTDVADDRLFFPSIVAGSSARTVIVLAKPAANNTCPLLDLNGQDTRLWEYAYYLMTPEIAVRINYANKVFSTQMPTSNFSIVTMENGASENISQAAATLDGVSLGQLSTVAASFFTESAGGSIGWSNVTSNYCSVDFGNVIVYDSALSDDDRNNLLNYLNSKWAVY